MAKLGEVCLLKAGKFVSANDISPEYNKGLYPCFGGNGIRGYVADYTHDGEFPLIGRQGALCGNVNLASGKFHATEHAVVVQPKIEMNVQWLYYALNAMNLGQYATGAAQPGLAVSKLETLSIEIPNISEQNKIAQNLYKVEQLVSVRKQQLAKLDELVKVRFVEMFGDPQENPRMWNKTVLSNLIINANNGLARRGCDADGQIVLRLVELQNGRIDYSSPNRIVLNDNEKKKYLLNENDLLFARVNGNPENVGRCAVFHEIQEPVYHNDHIIRVHFNETVLDGKFAEVILNSLYGKRQMRQKIKTSAGQYTISQDGISELSIIAPPISLQHKFSEYVKRIDQQKQSVQKSLEKLELMKKALMQEYFG